MSRIGYSEDEDYPGQFGLWQANCERSLHGKAGQAALRELEAVLLALPSKRLIANALVDSHGEVCAIGALVQYRGDVTDEMIGHGEYDMEAVGVELGMPRLVAWKVVCLNDIELNRSVLLRHEGPYRWPAKQPHSWVEMTPEHRYEEVLKWVRARLGEVTI